MKPFRTCLLVLLSITLPVQAVLAAAQGGCLMHAWGGHKAPATSSPAGAAALASPGAAALSGVAQARSTASNDGGCPHHRAAGSPGATEEAAAADVNPAGQAQAPGTENAAAAATPDAAAEPTTTATATATTTTTVDCSHCSGCCTASAPPSEAAGWHAPQERRSTLQQNTPAHPLLALSALERPPRAPMPVVLKA